MTYTSIRVTKETVERLADIGKKMESYDDIINKLLDHYHKKGNKK